MKILLALVLCPFFLANDLQATPCPGAVLHTSPPRTITQILKSPINSQVSIIRTASPEVTNFKFLDTGYNDQYTPLELSSTMQDRIRAGIVWTSVERTFNFNYGIFRETRRAVFIKDGVFYFVEEMDSQKEHSNYPKTTRRTVRAFDGTFPLGQEISWYIIDDQKFTPKGWFSQHTLKFGDLAAAELKYRPYLDLIVYLPSRGVDKNSQWTRLLRVSESHETEMNADQIEYHLATTNATDGMQRIYFKSNDPSRDFNASFEIPVSDLASLKEGYRRTYSDESRIISQPLLKTVEVKNGELIFTVKENGIYESGQIRPILIYIFRMPVSNAFSIGPQWIITESQFFRSETQEWKVMTPQRFGTAAPADFKPTPLPELLSSGGGI